MRFDILEKRELLTFSVTLTTQAFSAGGTPQVVIKATDTTSTITQVAIDVGLDGSKSFAGAGDVGQTVLNMTLTNGKATVIPLNAFPQPYLQSYFVRAHVEDALGNTKTSAIVTMAGPKPDTLTLTVPTTISATNDYATVKVTAGARNKLPSSVYLDVAPNTPSPVFNQYAFTAVLPSSGLVLIPITGLVAGSYKIRARIVDPAGDTDVSAVKTMTVASPAVTIKALPFQVGQLPQVTVSASDVNAITQVAIDVGLDSSSTFAGAGDLNQTVQTVTLVNNVPVTITLNALPTPYLAKYYVRARVLDSVGNQGTSATATMQGPQPDVVTMVLPKPLSFTGTNNVIVYVNAGQGNGYQPGAPVTISIDLNQDGIFEPNEQYASMPISAFGSVSIPVSNLNQLVPGTYRIQASIADLAGQTDVSATQTITVPNSSPTATSTTTPLTIVPNVGQVTYGTNVKNPPDVQYVVPYNSSTVFLSSNELDMYTPVTDSSGNYISSSENWQSMVLVNALTDAAGTAQDVLPSTTNYFINGLTATGVPNYGQTTFAGVYPNIDLTYSGTTGTLQYYFTIKPGGSPGMIAMSFPEATPSLDSAGNLVLTLSDGSNITVSRPLAYQVAANGTQQAVTSSFVVQGGVVSFAVGAYDTTRPLIIDPYIFTNFFGAAAGSNVTSAGMTQDSLGNTYILSNTNGANFAGLGGPAPAAQYAVVTELNSNGVPQQFSYIGGPAGTTTTGHGIAVDAAGYVYIDGSTTIGAGVPQFPMSNGTFSTADFGLAAGNTTGFVTILSPGSLVPFESTILGGSAAGVGTVATAIGIDGFGNLWVAGTTQNFSPPGVVLRPLTATTTMFLTKFAKRNLTKATGYQYTDLFGGSYNQIAPVATKSSTDKVFGMYIDAINRIYLVGSTNSTNTSTAANPWNQLFSVMPTTAQQSQPYIGTNPGTIAANGAGITTGFVLQFQEDTSVFAQDAILTYGSYIGGSAPAATAQSDAAGIYVRTLPAPNSATAFLYLTGTTNTTNFFKQVSVGLSQTAPAGAVSEAYLLELKVFPDNTQTTIQVAGTYLGAGLGEVGDNVAVDNSGNIYVDGVVPPNEPSAPFIFTKSSQSSVPPPVNATNTFLTELNSNATSILMGTLIGGNAAGETEFAAGVMATGLGGNVGGVSLAVDTLGNAYVVGLTNNFSSYQAVVTGNKGASTLYGSNPGSADDVFVAKVGPAVAPTYGPDPLESNDTSDTAASINGYMQNNPGFGDIIWGPFPNLNTIRHSNGLFDYDWYDLVTPSAGALTITISNIAIIAAGSKPVAHAKGDLDLFVYQSINGFLYLLGQSTLVNSSSQSVTVNVGAGAEVVYEVNPYNYTQATYTMSVSLT